MLGLDVMSERSSFRDGPQDQTRNLGIQGRRSASPGTTVEIRTAIGKVDDGAITERLVYSVPAARNWAPARCRLCGMLINNALRSATAL
jgi:hypothetical protein